MLTAIAAGSGSLAAPHHAAGGRESGSKAITDRRCYTGLLGCRPTEEFNMLPKHALQDYNVAHG